MASSGTMEVQSYLDGHRISSLFESLMSKLVKELPTDPVQFLISKLQAIDRQRKKAGGVGGVSTSRGSKMEVTGSSAPILKSSSTAEKPKQKKPSPAAGGSKTRRPAAGLSSSSSPTVAMTPGVVSIPARPTTSSGSVRPSSKPTRKAPLDTGLPPPRRPTTAPAGGGAGGSSRAPAATSSLKTTPKGTSSPSVAAKGAKLTTPSPLAAGAKGKRKPTGAAGTGVTKGSPSRFGQDGGAGARKKQPTGAPPTITKPTIPPPVVSGRQLLEDFFGETRKSSGGGHFQSPLPPDNDDDEVDYFGGGGVAMTTGTPEDDDIISDGGEEDYFGGKGKGRGERGGGGDSGDGERRGEGEEGLLDDGGSVVDVDLLLRKYKESKQPKKALSSKRRLDLVQEAQAPSPSSSSSSSGCYTSDGVESESSEDEEGVLGEVMEDEGALWEEEGVAVKGRGRGKEGSGKFVQRKPLTMSQSPTLDLKVMICARCAKVLSADEPTTEVSLSESKATTQHTTATTASSEGALEDFESASQVTGPRSLTSAAYKWRDPNVSEDASSEVTLKSHDTWGGLGPQPRPQVPPSDDDESELQLPQVPPLPLTGKPW